MLLAGWAVGGFPGNPLRADERVAVRATSAADYMAWKFGSGPPKDETYLFAEGRFFLGVVRDRSLTQTTFMQIATTLAGGLAKQHYYPTHDLKKADLLIVVHWGMTVVADSGYKLMAQTSIRFDDSDRLRRDLARSLADGTAYPAMGDSGGSVAFMGPIADTAYIGDQQAREANNVFQEVDQLASSLSMSSNAQLLGFTEELRRDLQSAFGTTEGEMIRSMLSDERYFVIVMAYDYQALLQEGKRRLLWSARLSMRSPGMNFREGIVDMSTVGGMYFGHQTDGVKVNLPALKEGRVEIGPVRVIGVTDGKL